MGKAGPESKPGLVVVPGTIGPEIDSARVSAKSEPTVPDVLPERRRGRSLFRRTAAQEDATRTAVPAAPVDGPTDVRFLTFDRPEAVAVPARPGDPELDVDADLDRGADLDFTTGADRTAGLELSFTRDTDFGTDPDRANELAPGPELFGLAALGLADADNSDTDEEWLADEDVPAAFVEEPEEELSGDFNVLDTDGAGTRSYLTGAGANGGQWDDQSGRRYGDRVEGWVRPQYQEQPAAGDYWTPVPESYGWPVPIERLRQVPPQPQGAGSDIADEIDAEATAIVPQWPPARTSGRIELPRSWSTPDQQDREQQDREQQDREQQDREQQDREQRDREQRDRELQDRELQDREQRDREQLDLEQRDREQRDHEQRDREQRDRERRDPEKLTREQQDREQQDRSQLDRALSAGSLFGPADRQEVTPDREAPVDHGAPDGGAADDWRAVVERRAVTDWRAVDDEQEEAARREANVRREEAIARQEMDARQEEYDRQKERKLRGANLRGADRFRSQVEEAFFNTGVSRRSTIGRRDETFREDGIGEGTRAIQIPHRVTEARAGENQAWAGEARIAEALPSPTPASGARVGEAWVGEARVGDAHGSEASIDENRAAESHVGGGDRAAEAPMGKARVGDGNRGQAPMRDLRAGELGVGEPRSGETRIGVAQVREAQADDIRGNKPQVGQDPVGQDLVGQKLVGQNLVGRDVVGRDLVGPDLAGPDLAGPDLAGPDLAGPDRDEASASDTPGKDGGNPDAGSIPAGDGDRSGPARRRAGMDGPIWLVPDLPDSTMPDLSWAPGQSATPAEDGDGDEEPKRFRRPAGMMRRRRAAGPVNTSASEATQALPALESAPRPRPRPRPTAGQPESRSTVYVSKHAAEPT